MFSPRTRGRGRSALPFSPPLGGEMPIGRGGVRAQRRRTPTPPPCARPPPLCRAATSPPAGGRKTRTPPSPIFSPPWGGDADRQRGGARAAPPDAHTTPCAPPAPLCRAATSPPAGGRKIPNAAVPMFSPRTRGRGRSALPFLPPWGGDADRQRGGARAAPPDALPPPHARTPPSVAPRHLPPQAGGENFPHHPYISGGGGG